VKLRHAAALALVGWYVIAPPYYVVPTTVPPYTNYEVDENATLDKWAIIDAYDSARECEAKLSIFVQLGVAPSDPGPNPRKNAALGERLRDCLCVATDDPRLKPK
jgi:hypothetical protein